MRSHGKHFRGWFRCLKSWELLNGICMLRRTVVAWWVERLSSRWDSDSATKWHKQILSLLGTQSPWNALSTCITRQESCVSWLWILGSFSDVSIKGPSCVGHLNFRIYWHLVLVPYNYKCFFIYLFIFPSNAQITI